MGLKKWILTLLFSTNIQAQVAVPLAEPREDDNFQSFLANLSPMTNIIELNHRGLAQGFASFQPWAGSYWPIHKGILGYRYADRSFPRSNSFTTNYSHYQSNPAENYIHSQKINLLSPAEKYDLLVGDTSWTLTRHMWQKGLDALQTNGVVAGWTGICHGWAAVNHMGVSTPLQGVTVRDVTGTYSIHFLPSDIRALLSYLWAESPPETIKAGNRCRQIPVGRDGDLRPTEPTCLDANPMTWHLTASNRLGIHGKSFVMDASFGSEVWNYPMSAYDYSYFNPRTLESTHVLNTAIEPLENLTADRFAAHRSPRTRYVVGVIMDAFHPALVEPNTGSSTEITYQTHSFIYDLELDENLNIIGGEWYSYEHPDFLWSFADGSQAMTREELSIDEPWNISSPIPSAYASAASRASQRGKVLSKIVNVIHTESIKQSVVVP